MEVTIRRMGNSQGILIPKPILAQLGLEGLAELEVRDGVIEIRPLRRPLREGWAEDARRLADSQGDTPVWPDLPTESDGDWAW